MGWIDGKLCKSHIAFSMALLVARCKSEMQRTRKRAERSEKYSSDPELRTSE